MPAPLGPSGQPNLDNRIDRWRGGPGRKEGDTLPGKVPVEFGGCIRPPLHEHADGTNMAKVLGFHPG